MKSLFAFGLITLATALSSSLAFARPDTAQMSCADAKALVAEKGAVVLSTGRQDIYARYVKNRLNCDSGESDIPAFVKTSDNPACHIGGVCSRDGSGTFIQNGKNFIPCKEGTFWYDTKQNSSGHDEQITVTCHAGKVYEWANGKIVPRPPAPVIIKCKDGQMAQAEVMTQSGRWENVWTVCKDGRFVRAW